MGTVITWVVSHTPYQRIVEIKRNGKLTYQFSEYAPEYTNGIDALYDAIKWVQQRAETGDVIKIDYYSTLTKMS